MQKDERALEIEAEGWRDGMSAFLSGCSYEPKSYLKNIQMELSDDLKLRRRYDSGFHNGYTYQALLVEDIDLGEAMRDEIIESLHKDEQNAPLKAFKPFEDLEEYLDFLEVYEVYI